MKRVSAIYQIKNLINSKMYIGQSKDVFRRFISHKSDLKLRRGPNYHLQKSWDLYGIQNFEFSIVEICPINSLDTLEKYYINKLKSTNRDFGYNILEGGNVPPNFSGKSHSEETKKKMSLSARGNTTWVGRHHKSSTKNKMSESGRGLKKKNQSSKYIGISWTKRNKKWACSIRYNHKLVWIGYFEDEIDGAKAYDKQAIEYYGLNTRLNFPEVQNA